MKKLKLLSFLLIIVSSSMFVVSCTKTGATGATGAKGATGPDSVLYSDPITLQMETDTIYYGPNNIYNYTGYADTLSAPAVTATVAQNDLVAGFIYFPTQFGAGDSSWISIDNTEMLEVIQSEQVGKIVIFCYGSWGLGSDISGLKYRYMILPSTISVSDANGQKQTITADQLKKMDYKTLTATLAASKSVNSGSIGVKSN